MADKSDDKPRPRIQLPPLDEVVAEITGHATLTVQGFVQRLTANLSRANGLLALYTILSSQIQEENENVKVTLDDLLRAVTVFLHASLEDFLRAVQRYNFLKPTTIR